MFFFGKLCWESGGLVCLYVHMPVSIANVMCWMCSCDVQYMWSANGVVVMILNGEYGIKSIDDK
jgi:hypothetical protein